MLFLNLSLYVSFCSASTGLWMPGTAPGAEVCTPATLMLPIIATTYLTEQSDEVSIRQVQWLRRYAQTITVTVWVDDRWSSGVLIRRQDQTYTVITNRHVVDFGKHFEVMTSDGQRYEASLQDHASFQDDDLALLQFQSSQVSYPIATFAPSLSLLPGTPVFAAGFPVDQKTSMQPQFRFTSGEVSLVSTKVLQGGYQLGYTNPIEKGMSGGPVLNRWGQVIAINGMHAYPLWGDPYIFTDGSKPNAANHAVMERSSWAIPTERFLPSLSAKFQPKQ